MLKYAAAVRGVACTYRYIGTLFCRKQFERASKSAKRFERSMEAQVLDALDVSTVRRLNGLAYRIALHRASPSFHCFSRLTKIRKL